MPNRLVPSLVRVLVLVLPIACAPEPAPPDPLATWLVSVRPSLRLGDSLPAGHEFAGIVTARRLSDGSFLVGNSGALELAWFDSTGHFVRGIGRKGSGPGEFATTVSLFAGPGDSLAVYDGGNLRWSIFSPSLTLSRTFATSEPGSPHPVWVHRGAMVTQASLQVAPQWIFPILDTLRAADPEVTRLIEGRIDDVGALWVKAGDGSTEWRIHAGPGAASAQATLPPGLRILQIGQDFVLGVTTDTVGLETVALFSLSRAPADDRPAPAVDPFPPAGVAHSHGESAADSTLTAQLSGVLMAQEGHYAQSGTYTARSDSLKYAFDPPARLFLLYGDKRRWTGIAVRLKTFATCGISVGFPSPAGWEDGTPLCDR